MTTPPFPVASAKPPSASELAWLESITRPPPPRKILLVEDEEPLRYIFKRVLSAFHCVVDEAEDGEKAIQSFDRGKPDVVILDLRLPIVDGFEVFAHIRERDKSLPVIVVTGRLDLDTIDRLYRSGYAIFARKPYDITPDFLEAILRPLFLYRRRPTDPPLLNP